MSEARRERGRRAWASGQTAETLAALWLRLKGYRVVARRFRTPVGEIDLIVRKGGLIAYVEVKARPSEAQALAVIGPAAQRRIARAAEWYGKRPGIAPLTQRFDVVAIAPWRLPRHIKNAWRCENTR